MMELKGKKYFFNNYMSLGKVHKIYGEGYQRTRIKILFFWLTLLARMASVLTFAW